MGSLGVNKVSTFNGKDLAPQKVVRFRGATHGVLHQVRLSNPQSVILNLNLKPKTSPIRARTVLRAA